VQQEPQEHAVGFGDIERAFQGVFGGAGVAEAPWPDHRTPQRASPGQVNQPNRMTLVHPAMAEPNA